MPVLIADFRPFPIIGEMETMIALPRSRGIKHSPHAARTSCSWMSNPKSCTLRTTRATDSFVVLVTKRTCARQRGCASCVGQHRSSATRTQCESVSVCVRCACTGCLPGGPPA